MPATEPDTTLQQSFSEDVLEVVHHVRSALAAVLDRLPERPQQARQLARVLGIDATLGWKIFKVTHESDPFGAAQQIPSRAAMASFRKAALRRKVPAKLLDAVDQAIGEFERVIERHAADRASFETMLNGYSASGGEIPLAVRRTAFKANRSIWGIEAETQLCAMFLAPGTREGMLDIVALRGFVGLKRLRPDVSWVVGRVRAASDEGVAHQGVVWKPLDEDQDDTSGAALLRPFCSQPLPQIRAVRTPSDIIVHEAAGGPVGNTAAMTCYTAQVARNAICSRRSEANRYGEVGAAAYTPCGVLVLDQFIREDVYGRIHPQVRVYGDLHEAASYPVGGRDRGVLPIRVEVSYLGKGPQVVQTPAVPQYPEMASYVFERLGWDAGQFDVYRVQIRFPVIPSLVVMSHPL